MPAKKKLTIASVASEVAPYTKTGGLADVASALPTALRKIGHHVIIITPLYFPSLKEQYQLKPLEHTFSPSLGKKKLPPFSVWWREHTKGIPIYFIDCPEILERKKRIYNDAVDNQSFLYFDNAVLALLKHLHIAPDILLCHDWHAGLIPYLAKRRLEYRSFFSHSASVFTIHNLAFQMGGAWFAVPKEKRDDGRRPLSPWGTPGIKAINFAKRGIIYADIISTVSEKYAEEILTKDFGADLQHILRNRSGRLFGIVNGIDYDVYNPATDPGLYQNYTPDTLHLKVKNKIAFQREVELPQTSNQPMIALTSRISEQKGFDLIMDIIDPLLRLNVQLVILGEGEKRYEQFFQKMQRKSPRRIYTQFHFNPKRETQILAASDMLLLPSRFEPCGIGQLKSLRYGCIPIVRRVGGLADTITDFHPTLNRGNGFTFGPYDSRDLLVAITRAVENYRHRRVWAQLVKRAMQQSFSWEVPAMKYAKMFRRAVKIRNQNHTTKQATRQNKNPNGH